MEARSLSPIQVATFCWKPSTATFARTIVCKATYDLVSGRAPLAENQDPIVMTDEHYDDDPNASVYRPTDRVPFKTRADIVLVGEAYAPGGEPARSVVVELMVREMQKVIEVYRDRHFNHGGDLVEGKRFVSMPLRWERARGGELTSNPVGLDPEGERDRYGRLVVPNLQQPGLSVSEISDVIEPVGMGPTGPFWPWRAALLGRHLESWDSYYWTDRPLPTDIDSSFFNCAPRDQRLDALSESERIALVNLHPQEPRLVCHLPGSKPVAFIERGGAAREVELRPDTLWIDTSRCVVTMTWRGRIDVQSPQEAGVILVGQQEQGHKLTWAHLNALARGERPASEMPVAPAAPIGPAAVPPGALPPGAMPMAVAPPGAVPPAVHPAMVPPADAVPPTVAGGPAAAPYPPAQQPAPRAPAPPAPMAAYAAATPPARKRLDTLSIDEGTMVAAMPQRAALPFQQKPDAPPPVAIRDDPVPSTTPQGHTEGALPTVEDHAPPWLRSMLGQQQKQRATGVSGTGTLIHEDPDATRPTPPAPPPVADYPPPPIPPAPAPMEPAAVETADGSTPPPAPVPPAPVAAESHAGSTPPPPVAASSDETTPVGMGRLGVGIALRDTQAEIPIPEPAQVVPRPSAPAAESEPPPPSSTLPPQSSEPPQPSVRGVVQLMWASPKAPERLRSQPAWAKLDEDAEPDLDEAARDKRLVIALLRQGASMDIGKLRQQMLRATQALTGYRPPLALLGGKLSFAFDPLEALKATATVLAPQALGDEKLSTTLRAVSEHLEASWMQSAEDAARKLTAQLRAAAPMDDPTVDEQVRRVLIGQRAYLQRRLFGEPHIVAHLRLEDSGERIPSYIPAAQGGGLPMFEQMSARLVVAAHLRQDQFEGHDVAFQVIAVGRHIDLSAGG